MEHTILSLERKKYFLVLEIEDLGSCSHSAIS